MTGLLDRLEAIVAHNAEPTCQCAFRLEHGDSPEVDFEFGTHSSCMDCGLPLRFRVPDALPALLQVARLADRVERAHNALYDGEHHDADCIRCRAVLANRVAELRSALASLGDTE